MGEHQEIRKSPREVLHLLEKEGKYVFHGSANVIDELEPRIGEEYDPESGIKKSDEHPAVYATVYADVATFRAIVSKNNLRGIDCYSSFGADIDGKLKFEISKGVLEKLKERGVRGFVYILSKDDFIKTGVLESKSIIKIKPLKRIEVSVDDLPENIEIIEKSQAK